MPDDHAGHGHVWADDLTRNQELVLSTLAHADAPMSAYDILDKLRDDGLRAPLQVYRALDKLTQRGLAHRRDDEAAFAQSREAHETRGAAGFGGHRRRYGRAQTTPLARLAGLPQSRQKL